MLPPLGGTREHGALEAWYPIEYHQTEPGHLQQIYATAWKITSYCIEINSKAVFN